MQQGSGAKPWKPDYSYNYAPVQYDLSSKAIFGSDQDLQSWQKIPRARLQKQILEIQSSLRVRLSSTRTSRNDIANVDELTYEIVSDKLSRPLLVTISRWTPLRNSLSSPVIVALSGHEDCGAECSGRSPKHMVGNKGYAQTLVQRGWTVVGASTAIHKPLASYSPTYDYPLIWAALTTLLLEKAIPAGKPIVYLGNSVGGITAVVASIVDRRAVATVTNGAFFPLAFTRQSYRIKDHPLCHDMREFASYVSLYALLSPLPLMIQVGEQDSLWMGLGPVKPNDWFSGLPRGSTSDETVGAAFLLQRLWVRAGAPFALAVRHGGAHEDLDAARVDSFLRPLFRAGTSAQP